MSTTPESQAAPPPESPRQRFHLGALSGELSSRLQPSDLEREVRRIADPGSARETVHWGRSYLYAMEIATTTGPIEVAVKQFRNESWRARRRRRTRGSKAESSWRAALRLQSAGLPTPEPIMWIESEPETGPSFYVARRVDDFFEARYFFRALNAGRAKELFPAVDGVGLIEQFARTLRRLHDIGVRHRDASIGNLLVRLREGAEPEVLLIDLGRSRIDARLGVGRRTRDICRLPLMRRSDREVFLEAYWGESPGVLKRLLYEIDARAFRTRNRLKTLLRRPVRSVREALTTRGAHPHIPRAPDGASPRDKTVWDHLSDQPHQHAAASEQLRNRLADAGVHVRALAAVCGSAPASWRRYRALKRRLYRTPVAFGGVGVALQPQSAAIEGTLAAIDELGAEQVLIRLHPWDEDHEAAETLARELHERQIDLAFALPQNRALVCDPARWRASIEDLASRFRPYGKYFQVGQAVNRSKWGFWNHREWEVLMGAASEVLRSYPATEILGPAIIDWEPYVNLGLLNVRQEAIRFDIVSSLLYVDRRGAPENCQAGFDTVDKALQLKAIAETARNSEARHWITEVNWPLKEGPHSPAGRAVSVDEEQQADFLARYYLLVLCCAGAERVYWWQLVARGYGLIDTDAAGALRRRPSFRALKTLRSELGGSTFVGRLDTSDPGRLHSFTTSGGEQLVVGWSTGSALRARLPRPVAHAIGRDGDVIEGVDGVEVELVSGPRYFHLVR